MNKQLLFIAILLLGTLKAEAQSFTIIVNESNSISSISKAEVSKLFLKKTSKWSDGTKVDPVDLAPGSSVRDEFSDQILGKSVNAIKSYWQQFVFAGKGTPPTEKKNDTEVIDYVKSNPGAIAYISSTTKATGVKILTIN